MDWKKGIEETGWFVMMFTDKPHRHEIWKADALNVQNHSAGKLYYWPVHMSVENWFDESKFWPVYMALIRNMEPDMRILSDTFQVVHENVLMTRKDQLDELLVP